MFCREPDENTGAGAKQNHPDKPDGLSEAVYYFFVWVKIHQNTPQAIKSMENNEGQEAHVEGNPSGRAEPVDHLVIISGGIPAGTEMKSKEMDGHSYDQQEGSNPL